MKCQQEQSAQNVETGVDEAVQSYKVPGPLAALSLATDRFRCVTSIFHPNLLSHWILEL